MTPQIATARKHALAAHPALKRRSTLRERRPRIVRRHTARVIRRLSVLLLGDVAAIFVARQLCFWFLDLVYLPALGLFGTALVSDGPRFAIAAALTIGSLFITGAHSRHRTLNQAVRIFGGVFGAMTLYQIFAVASRQADWGDLRLIIETSLILGSSLYLVRQLSEAFLHYFWPAQRGTAAAILIGSPEAAGRYERAIASHGGDYKVLGYVSPEKRKTKGYLGTIDDLQTIVAEHDAEAVVLCADLPTPVVGRLVENCLMLGCQILYPAGAIHIENVQPKIVWFQDQPFFELGSPVLQAKALVSKRILDFLLSGILIVLLSPLLVLMAIAIRLDSPGPAFFVQERAGLGGKRFRMIKFRTMRMEADADKDQLEHLNHSGDRRLFKIRNDPRTTKFGRFLRRWSLDELPQLFNVLKGEMSLVGPRPFFEADFAIYEDHHFRRLDAKPGITGLWQVSGRSEILHFEDVIFLDRQYIERWSFWLDVSILFRTIPAVLRRTGAF